MDNTDDTETLNKALRLLVKISAAAGDSEGKLTLTELVERIRRMREGLEGIQMIPSNQPQHVYEVMVKAITRTALQ